MTADETLFARIHNYASHQEPQLAGIGGGELDADHRAHHAAGPGPAGRCALAGAEQCVP